MAAAAAGLLGRCAPGDFLFLARKRKMEQENFSCWWGRRNGMVVKLPDRDLLTGKVGAFYKRKREG